tara:strand:+ start:578 stop:778 length:201 start_codon:yes stop_codon:yes gene_type:complete
MTGLELDPLVLFTLTLMVGSGLAFRGFGQRLFGLLQQRQVGLIDRSDTDQDLEVLLCVRCSQIFVA